MFQLPLSHNMFFKQLSLGVLTVKSTRHLTLYRVKDIHSNKDSVGCDAEVKVQYLCLLENNRFCGTGYLLLWPYSGLVVNTSTARYS